MGIPSYYKNLIKDYPDIIKPNTKSKINNLFLDLNCAIHPCCANKTDENEMLDEIFKKILECITITKVSDLVYIAIDGPAPRTKMEQQRYRRLRSSKEKKVWDTNQITPGTSFMDKLIKFLNCKCKLLKVKYIISDSNEPGEGEHKIMKYMDTLNKGTINVVYGLDADLIMLSMIRDYNVLLLRERTEYNIENLETNYIFLDISFLKKYLLQSIKKDYYNISDNTILHDYLFLCFFIGNDFIINSPSINIRYNGLNILLSIYSDLQKDYYGNFYLLENDKINYHNLKLLIQRMAISEENNINEISKKRNKLEERNKRNYYHILNKRKIININDVDKCDENDFDINKEEYENFKNFSPLIFRKEEKKVLKNMDKLYYIYNKYKEVYYNPSYDQVIEEEKTKLCEDYLKSIVWTTSYYFDKCSSWKWYYKHHYAPLFKDLFEYLQKYDNFTHLELNDQIPYTPQEQLKIVLPNQEDTYYYPKSTPLHSFMKQYYWECHPIMPH
jgi:5'-3' exoribonuclease 2